MAFDSTVMAAVTSELSEKLTGGRISKIYQPQGDELTLLIYARGQNYRLLLSANPRFARLHLTSTEKKNPPAPPTYCMLLRKYIDGGRILSIRQAGRERIARIQIGVTDELGNPAEYVLVAEVMGKHSNVVLVGPQGRIVDAIRRVTEEVNRYRELLPGLPYIPPPPQNKLDPALLTAEQLVFAGERPAWQALLDQVDGLGPLLAKEAVVRAGYPALAQADEVESARLAATAPELTDPREYDPALLFDGNGRLKEFHVLPLTHWPGRRQAGFDSANACVDAFFGRRDQEDRVGALRGSLSKVVQGELTRVRKKAALQAEALETAENAEEYRIKGELITANLWQIKKGDNMAQVTDYYDPDGREVSIPLDPLLTPAANAGAYYRRYQKARHGLASIQEQLERSHSERAYLEQVDASLGVAESLPDLEEIRRELQSEGYLSDRSRRREPRAGKGAAPSRERKDLAAPPLTICSSDGLEIWIGRNNRQNDYLTLKLAAPHDLWFHTKEIPGSHVILRAPAGQAVPEQSIHEAAALAAWHSKGRASASVPVDYTLRKHVRKPSGARPGMVIYEHQKTLWVTPDLELNPILKRHFRGEGAVGMGATADANASVDSRPD